MVDDVNTIQINLSYSSCSSYKMSSPVSKIVRKVVKNEEEVAEELCSLIEKLSNESIKQRGSFTIGLSGGSMAKFVCNGIPSIQTEWGKWSLFFCDERLVPFTAEDSTYRLYRNGLVGKTPLKEEQFIAINPDLEVTAAAKDYEEKVRAKFPDCDWPKFDLLLLGMGPDGHTASLFPGHQLLKEDNVWIAAISDSPKPPPCRVTMTFPVINAARCCVFAMAGQGKADMVKRILGDGEELPTGMVKPVRGELIWILDEAAASKL
ncbi:6-phosphogluconolactonase-like [Homarus americanus]|uniref:6-phosphogluconolactonase n=1 Tax=Homarus americanus TaxID=6706 RepID=A0A8J5TC12_HOMAM|nr:6-phosphogluconolactonase-like [Homarus americanus]KAG7171498.1 6-phosphogluconolactonase-like [Homarus americanus]